MGDLFFGLYHPKVFLKLKVGHNKGISFEQFNPKLKTFIETPIQKPGLRNTLSVIENDISIILKGKKLPIPNFYRARRM
jgi:hypothetical protein